LSFKFLLNTNDDTDQPSDLAKLKADSRVKVLVKAVAFECVIGAVSLRPQLMFYSVYASPAQRGLNRAEKTKRPQSYLDESDADESDADSETSDDEEEVSGGMEAGEKVGLELFAYDLVNYVNHPDDKMKANACSLIGQLINAVLIENGGEYDIWLSRMVRRLMLVTEGSARWKRGGGERGAVLRAHACEAYNSLRLEVLVDHLMRFIRFDSMKVSNNMCKKAALR